MPRGWIVLLLLLAVAASVGAVSASGHDDPCHQDRSCPSDDHSYVWSGMSCTSDPNQRLPEDQTPVDYGGQHYYCHTVTDGGMSPTPTPDSSATTTPTAAATATPTSTAAAAPPCGVRSPVRTLSDPGAANLDLAGRDTTIRRLHARRAPALLARSRAGAERHAYRARAQIVSAQLADSGAWVVTLRGGPSLTAEFPSEACAARATRARSRMRGARAQLISACHLEGRAGRVFLTGSARVTGVGFFRAARSRLSLRPVVGLSELTCQTAPGIEP